MSARIWKEKRKLFKVNATLEKEEDEEVAAAAAAEFIYFVNKFDLKKLQELRR